jgi:hypothetical protein
MYRLDKNIMIIESGLNGKNPDVLLKELKKSVEYCDTEEIVWVKNFFRRQIKNSRFGIGALKSIKELPIEFRHRFLAYNSKTLKSFDVDIPYRYTIDTRPENEKNLDTNIIAVSVSDTVTVKPRKSSVTYTREFLDFWEEYPNKIGKGYAFECYKRIKAPKPSLEELIKAIERYKQSPQWLKDGGDYIPNPSTWINQRRWEDEPKEGRRSI